MLCGQLSVFLFETYDFSTALTVGHLLQGHLPVRHCFHPGISSDVRESLGSVSGGTEITSNDMLKAMMSYIWPKDDEMIRKRVMISLGLLVGSKVLNVCVPFIFKAAIDGFGALSMDTAPDAVLAGSVSLLLGCK